MKQITAIFLFSLFLLVPQYALAFMDAPTITTIFPSYLILFIPIIILEVIYVSNKLKNQKSAILKSSFLTHLLTLVLMILIGWIHTYVRHKFFDITGMYGIFTVLRNPPPLSDIVLSLTIGSVVLIQDASYMWLNLIVITVFLLPTFILSAYFGIRLFSRFCPDVDKSKLKSTIIRIRLAEFMLLIIASFAYLNFIYEL
jgi:hypothetical protein